MSEQQPVWKIKSNDFVFSIDEMNLNEVDIKQKSHFEFSCIKNGCSVIANVIDNSADSKKIKVEVDGEFFDVEIRDRLDQMLDEMGFSKTSSKQIKEIKAPMPGMVLDITVKEGQEVKEGDKLLILGAMKMENSITISADAIIKRIAVSAGQAVEKGQVLVELQ